MEKLLNKVTKWESNSSSSLFNPSAEMICNGFSNLRVLYECLEDLFNTNSNDTMKWTDELLDVSVKFLDICYNVTDIMSQIKQHVRDLGCDLRRNDRSSETIISKYIEFRSKLKKEIKGSVSSLKQVKNMIIRGCPNMITILREVTSFSILVFRTALEFLAVSPLRKRRTRTQTPRRRWNVVSRLVFLSGSKVVPEEKADHTSAINELQQFYSEVLRWCCSASSEKHELLQVVPKKIEALETTIEDISSHLHLLTRRLIMTRASILNMISFN